MVKKRKGRFLPFLVFIFLIICIGILASIYFVNAVITRQYGKPAESLTLTQRIMYPVELFLHRDILNSPASDTGRDQPFSISSGESVSMICIRLEQSGLIEDAELLRTYLVYSGLDRKLQSGQFTLNPGMSPIEIVFDLLDATPSEAVITILPGWRIEEVAVNVAGSGLALTKEAFISEAYSPLPIYVASLPVDILLTLEGFLFPGTYQVPREATLSTVFEYILTEFRNNVDDDLIYGFTKNGLSVYESVILASIIEKEAVIDDEKPLIASVFLNRLSQGMRLETDPTVQYALGYYSDQSTWWKSPLSMEDLAIESPYNTYIVYGLPPTPICNPDLSSLRAVAFPAETPYFYFRAACDGSGRHNFAITYEEHLNNACE